MDQYIGALIGRYRSRGVLVDTNVLLLYFVGAYDSGLVERFSRTRNRGFTSRDFYTLVQLLGQFDRFITTPHVLTEVSNWLTYLEEPARSACFRHLIKDISLMSEQRTMASTLSNNPAFMLFGITDTAILDATPPGAYLVLTDDLPLYGYLSNLGVDVLNFNHIRQFE